jgi:hypothetical protein
MTWLVAALVFFLTGCGSLVVEQRLVKLNTDLQSIQQDFHSLSATFTPEQSEKYAQAQAARDDATFQEFYTSLNPQQQAALTALLDRAHQAAQEQQILSRIVQQDLARQEAERRRLPQGFGIVPANSVL